MSKRFIPFIPFVLCVLAACAPASGTGSNPTGATPSEQRSGNLITQAEIEKSGATTALQAVRLLRPQMLRSMGAASATPGSDPGVVVYANGMKLGGIETLDGIGAPDVKSIQYLSASDATQRFGTGHPHGAILVTRK